MKKISLFFIVAFISTVVCAQRPGAVADVQHYDFDITLSDSTDVIKGKTNITVSFIQNAAAFTVDLVGRQNGKGMQVLQVTENGNPLAYTHTNDQLTIRFKSAVKAGEQKQLTITYEGAPADGLVIRNNKYGRRGFFADNWPNRAHNWLPCVDHPADKASLEFTVTAPAHYQVISNGVRTEDTLLNTNTRRTHYKEEMPLSTKIMVIGVADFAVQQSGTVNAIPVYSWVYPEEKDPGFYDYAQAVDILPYFIKHVGPFAFKKLANVESTTIFGGMENAGAIFYSDEASITGKRSSESLLAHEIAHQWFGDMATEADWEHLWLSEGFATYMTILYFEHTHGTDTARAMLQKNRRQVIDFAGKRLRPVVDTSVTDYMELLNANSYQKGGWVLHMLRRQLGDSIFWKGIREYYSQYAGKNATTDDLRKVMETVSGKNLTTFFQQWLFAAGHPKLEVRWKYDHAKKAVDITVVQTQPGLFQFPLELQIGEGSRHTVQIKDKQTSVRFAVPAKPSTVTPDPAVNLLFEGSIKELR
jgi:aminopeptidase N